MSICVNSLLYFPNVLILLANENKFGCLYSELFQNLFLHEIESVNSNETKYTAILRQFIKVNYSIFM